MSSQDEEQPENTTSPAVHKERKKKEIRKTKSLSKENTNDNKFKNKSINDKKRNRDNLDNIIKDNVDAGDQLTDNVPESKLGDPSKLNKDRLKPKKQQQQQKTMIKKKKKITPSNRKKEEQQLTMKSKSPKFKTTKMNKISAKSILRNDSIKPFVGTSANKNSVNSVTFKEKQSVLTSSDFFYANDGYVSPDTQSLLHRSNSNEMSNIPTVELPFENRIGDCEIDILDSTVNNDLNEVDNIIESTESFVDINSIDERRMEDGRQKRRDGNLAFEKRQKVTLERRAKIEEKRRAMEAQKLSEMMADELRQKELEEEWRLGEELRAQQKLSMIADKQARELALENERKEAARKRANALERERLEREAALARMSVLLAQRQAEEQLKLAKEKLAQEIEEALRAKEQQLLAAMTEEERTRYLAERRHEEEEKRREEEQRMRDMETERLRREQERERKIAELEAEFERARQLKRRYVVGSFLRSRQLLYLAQKISRAYTYSYFGKLPRIDLGNNNNNKTSVMQDGNILADGYEEKNNRNIHDLPSLTEIMSAMEEKS